MKRQPATRVASGDIIGSHRGLQGDQRHLLRAPMAPSPAAIPRCATSIEAVGEDPYGAGWLYEVDGDPDAKCVDARQYRTLLDTTIDRILEKQ